MSKLIDFDLGKIKTHGGIIGVDEVGRGCLAGPLVVAACYLDAEIIEANRALLEEANDSKVLSEAQRTKLSDRLSGTIGVPLVVVQASPAMVDGLNPLKATLACWQTATEALLQHRKAGLILVDGNQVWRGSKVPLEAVVKGDATSCAIACASIVAKAVRDEMMVQADIDDMEHLGHTYNHSKHKGYGTPEHLLLLHKYGPSKRHRLTFDPIKTWIAQGSTLPPEDS